MWKSLILPPALASLQERDAFGYIASLLVKLDTSLVQLKICQCSVRLSLLTPASLVLIGLNLGTWQHWNLDIDAFIIDIYTIASEKSLRKKLFHIVTMF